MKAFAFAVMWVLASVYVVNWLALSKTQQWMARANPAKLAVLFAMLLFGAQALTSNDETRPPLTTNGRTLISEQIETDV